MPATLGHIGAQYLATRLFLPKADAKWILAGCVVPDVPWIVQRIVPHLIAVSPIELRLYLIAQSTLLVSLFLCAFLALFSRKFWAVLAILALGTALHLGLDAMQTKWANGVVLWAPLRWDMLNFGLFWPEDWPTYALYGLSIAAGIRIWTREPRFGGDLQVPTGWRAAAAVVLLVCYVALPAIMKAGVRTADLHYAATMEDAGNRTGKPVEFDRSHLETHSGSVRLKVWSGEKFELIAPASMQGDTVSIRGGFETPSKIRVDEFHIHPSGVRSFASYVALLAITLWWTLCIKSRIRR